MVTRKFTHGSTFANGGEYVLIEVFSISIATRVLFNGDLSRKNVFISRCLVAQFTCGDLLCCDTCLNKIPILTIHMKIMSHGAEVYL